MIAPPAVQASRRSARSGDRGARRLVGTGRGIRGATQKIILKAGSAAVVVAVAVRVAMLLRWRPLPILPGRLRHARLLPVRLRNPERLAAAVDRMGRLLPPWGLGWCLKRSLFLLDLWSRCGLEPRLHVGVRRLTGRNVEGHAWLSVLPLNGATGEPSAEERFVEAWVA